MPRCPPHLRCVAALRNVEERNWRNYVAFNTRTLAWCSQNWQTKYAEQSMHYRSWIKCSKVLHCTQIHAICATRQLRHRWRFATMPDIDQTLLQFIDIMNLLDRCCSSPHTFAVNRVNICAVGWQKVCWNERGCLVSEGWLFVPRAGWAGTLPRWKPRTPQISRMTGSRLWARSTSR